MKRESKGYFSQWAGQFYVAYELSKRGYVASVITGNAVETDILAKSPSGIVFPVEVKTLRKPNPHPLRKPLDDDNKIWFFVLLNAIGEEPTVTILTNKEVQGEYDDHLLKCPNDVKATGIYNKVLREKYGQNNWEKLPS